MEGILAQAESCMCRGRMCRVDRAVKHFIIAAKLGFDKSLKKSRINIKICLLPLFVATRLLWMQQKVLRGRKPQNLQGGSRRSFKGGGSNYHGGTRGCQFLKFYLRCSLLAWWSRGVWCRISWRGDVHILNNIPKEQQDAAWEWIK